MVVATYWQPPGTHRLWFYCFMFTNMTNNNRGKARVGEVTEIQLFNAGVCVRHQIKNKPRRCGCNSALPDATCDVWRVRSSPSLRTRFPLRAPEWVCAPGRVCDDSEAMQDISGHKPVQHLKLPAAVEYTVHAKKDFRHRFWIVNLYIILKLNQ